MRMALRRRTYLINKPIQFGYAGIVIWLMLNMSLVVGAATYFTTIDTILDQMESAGSTSFNVYDVVTRINGILMYRLGIMFLALVAVAGVSEIFFLHRIVGPIHAIQTRLQSVLAGEAFRPIVLRKKDYFQSLADVVNGVMEARREKDEAVEALLAAAEGRPELAELVARVRSADAEDEVPPPVARVPVAEGAGRRGGFSMVELMIVVAITAILAAIASWKMRELQLKAKRAELPLNANGIRTAEVAYDASFDTYLELSLSPRDDASLDKDAVPWNPTSADWANIGWSPDGLVRGNYQVGTSLVDHPEDPFMITARSDLDGDDALCEYTATLVRTPSITEIRRLLY